MDVECEAIDQPRSVSLVFLSVYLIKYRCFVSGEGAPGRATPHRVSKKKNVREVQDRFCRCIDGY